MGGSKGGSQGSRDPPPSQNYGGHNTLVTPPPPVLCEMTLCISKGTYAVSTFRDAQSHLTVTRSMNC